ncbi:MAG: type II toxin-antitoxin system RelE/ParE family toxin [Bdellovibrio sp.]|nr:type II toxin-antitoxin system RelE/ParE family toxin [Bdellovibrio sp.]
MCKDEADFKVSAQIGITPPESTALKRGNLGQYKALGTGLFELKFDFGPGYRIYFAVDGGVVILLLSGGDKSPQRRDIEKARKYWTDYLMRRRK